jgi:CRP/FNR family cyclic AMP-dependent transcriptional regulator
VSHEVALLDDRPRSASAIASTDCKVAVIDLNRFGVLVQQTPFFAVDVMRVMAERLRRITGQGSPGSTFFSDGAQPPGARP